MPWSAVGDSDGSSINLSGVRLAAVIQRQIFLVRVRLKRSLCESPVSLLLDLIRLLSPLVLCLGSCVGGADTNVTPVLAGAMTDTLPSLPADIRAICLADSDLYFIPSSSTVLLSRDLSGTRLDTVAVLPDGLKGTDIAVRGAVIAVTDPTAGTITLIRPDGSYVQHAPGTFNAIAPISALWMNEETVILYGVWLQSAHDSVEARHGIIGLHLSDGAITYISTGDAYDDQNAPAPIPFTVSGERVILPSYADSILSLRIMIGTSEEMQRDVRLHRVVADSGLSDLHLRTIESSGADSFRVVFDSSSGYLIVDIDQFNCVSAAVFIPRNPENQTVLFNAQTMILVNRVTGEIASSEIVNREVAPGAQQESGDRGRRPVPGT